MPLLPQPMPETSSSSPAEFAQAPTSQPAPLKILSRGPPQHDANGSRSELESCGLCFFCRFTLGLQQTIPKSLEDWLESEVSGYKDCLLLLFLSSLALCVYLK